MTNEQKEKMKKELWYHQFTQTLYNKGLISEEDKQKLEIKITHKTMH